MTTLATRPTRDELLAALRETWRFLDRAEHDRNTGGRMVVSYTSAGDLRDSIHGLLTRESEAVCDGTREDRS